MSAHPATRAYVARRTTEGLTENEIIRCLKRYLTREVYAHLRTCPAAIGAGGLAASPVSGWRMTIMTSDGDTVALLGRALEQTAAIIAAIPVSQAGLATPCPGWDVAMLVRHLTAQDLRNFLASARGEAADWQAPADELGQDWAADFRDRAARLTAVWQQADLDQLLPMPGGGQSALRSRADQQIAELAMHGWDLVVATGQQTGLDPVLAEHALRWSRQMLRPEYRGPDRAFGAEVPVPPDAPAYQRLAGWFGRDPNWTPPGNTADRRH